MATQDDVLAPLPYEDAPTSRFKDDVGDARDVSEETRTLTPDTPPASENEAGLLGSPLRRLTFSSTEEATDRGALLDEGHAPSAANSQTQISPDDARVRVLPDITVPPNNHSGLSDVVPVKPDAPTATKITEMVTRRDLARLKADTTELYQKVSTLLSNNPTKAALALGWLNEARTIGLGQPEQFPTAELRVNQTRTLLAQFEQSQLAVREYATRIVGWNIVGLLLFGALFVLDQLNPPYLLRGVVSIGDLFAPWLAVLAGGMGGAMGALGALGEAVSRREYNADDNLDYYLNAPKGAILGGIAFYLVLGGFVTVAATANLNLQGTVAGNNFVDALQQSSSTSPLFIVLAFVAGLAQQRVLRLLGRVWNERTGDSDIPSPANAPTDLAAVPVQDVPVPVATEVMPPFDEPLESDSPDSEGGMG